jgi:hypothetical protein
VCWLKQQERFPDNTSFEEVGTRVIFILVLRGLKLGAYLQRSNVQRMKVTKKFEKHGSGDFK